MGQPEARYCKECFVTIGIIQALDAKVDVSKFSFGDASVIAVIKKDNGTSAIYPEELNCAFYFNESTNPISYSRKFQDKYEKLKNLIGNQ